MIGPSPAPMDRRRPLLPTSRNGIQSLSGKQRLASSASTAPTSTTTATRKRARSPCADEVAYRTELLPQCEALEAAQAKHATELAELQQTILSFYLCHMIEVESQLSSSEVNAPAAAARSRIPYYHSSAIATARAARAKLEAQRRTERDLLEKSIADMEAEVQRTIVKGVLAEQRAVTEAEAHALAHREEALRQCQATTAALEKQIADEKNQLPGIAADMEACDNRIHLLEERKRKQMENVELTRQEVVQQRQRTRDAEVECQRRQANVADLEGEIERRLRLLKRARRRD